ncbi:MAG: hypothetical protein OEM05_11845 [Myxococcales bacterium]|nr:hypothetical protein [Myxococcales bacterium]
MKLRKPPTDSPTNAPRGVDGGLAAFLRHTYPGPRQFHKALSLWPLLPAPDAPRPNGLEYVPLADALEDGFVSVQEVDASGSVPHVRVENRAATAVLVLFGEELRGAKQNRVANASFLLPPREERVIDVSCVEQGRWGRRRGFFAAEDLCFGASAGTLSSAIRRKMLKKVSRSRARTGTYDADQGEVWESVSERLAQSGVRSPSEAYADYARSRQSDIGEMAQSFHVMKDAGQVGFVAAIGDEIVGLEAIGRGDVFARAFPTLLHAYAIDAADAAQLREPGRLRFESPQAFLAAVASAPARSGASLGMGQDLRLESDAVEGCALVANGALVHLTAFPHAAD